MMPTVCVDFDRWNEDDQQNYRTRVSANVALFQRLFGNIKETYSDVMPQISGIRSQIEYVTRIKYISSCAGISFSVAERINFADELLSGGGYINSLLGCTSIARNGVIGQTLDLFSVNLAIIRKNDTLSITMPPYLTLFGMNKHVSFCTNYIGGTVQQGMPISFVRHHLLNCNSIDEVVKYLDKTQTTTSVNFLVSDGEKSIDIEKSPTNIHIHEEILSPAGTYLAHTNHFTQDIKNDSSCIRLSTAVGLLQQMTSMQEILDDTNITLPVYDVHSIGFGSIIKVVMDVKQGILWYKQPGENEYKKVCCRHK